MDLKESLMRETESLNRVTSFRSFAQNVQPFYCHWQRVTQALYNELISSDPYMDVYRYTSFYPIITISDNFNRGFMLNAVAGPSSTNSS